MNEDCRSPGAVVAAVTMALTMISNVPGRLARMDRNAPVRG